ncbi:MAG: hypothetical protein KAW41_04415 [Candidatus Diapherotrites archaeon]|nr:hypothetical protein [Candidatus Diapherotrites archaeon]
MAKPRKRISKIAGGSGAVQAQSIQRTLTWTNPLKFLQNIRYQSFLGDDKKKALEGPHPHAPFGEKVRHHLDRVQRKTGKRSLSHVTPKTLKDNVSPHLDKVEEEHGRRSLWAHLLEKD